jgi:hypothetical protein
LQIFVESKKMVEHGKGFMNKDKREIPTTNNLSEDADGDE